MEKYMEKLIDIKKNIQIQQDTFDDSGIKILDLGVAKSHKAGGFHVNVEITEADPSQHHRIAIQLNCYNNDLGLVGSAVKEVPKVHAHEVVDLFVVLQGSFELIDYCKLMCETRDAIDNKKVDLHSEDYERIEKQFKSIVNFDESWGRYGITGKLAQLDVFNPNMMQIAVDIDQKGVRGSIDIVVSNPETGWSLSEECILRKYAPDTYHTAVAYFEGHDLVHKVKEITITLHKRD